MNHTKYYDTKDNGYLTNHWSFLEYLDLSEYIDIYLSIKNKILVTYKKMNKKTKINQELMLYGYYLTC